MHQKRVRNAAIHGYDYAQMSVNPFQPKPFFQDKNRAFWNLQLLGWAGAFILRGISGLANGQPISFLIPCHRAIRKTGVISDYHWGRARKLALIGWEQARAEKAGAAA